MRQHSLFNMVKNSDILLGLENGRLSNGSCALVGNSGILMDNEYGELIDSHDVVIRCNCAHTDGYVKHVGSQTDIRIANSHMFHAVLQNTTLDLEEMNSKFSKFERYFLYSLQNEIIVAKNSVHPSEFRSVIEKLKNEGNNDVVFFNPAAYNGCINLVGNHPTTGLVGLLVALKYFKKISCFGFTFYEETDWSKKHYYEDITPYEMTSHSFLQEKQLFSELNEAGIIEMYPNVFRKI
jgi:hypothetical protein